MIGILDYGVGNVLSVTNILKHIGVECFASSSIEELSHASHFILPGIGRFDHGWNLLDKGGYVRLLKDHIEVKKKPILGICLGAHFLTAFSEEGNCKGFGWIAAKAVRFSSKAMTPRLPVPHMGWNDVHVNHEHALTRHLPPHPRFYFLHSYHFAEVPLSQSMMSTTYGYNFSCGIASNNVMGVQFHPEKSHKYGMQLLRNFSEIGSYSL